MAHTRLVLLAVMLVLVLAVSGCTGGSSPAATGKPPATGPTGESQGAQSPNEPAQPVMTVVVYHATADAMYLVGEKHTISKNSHPAKTALEQLLQPPQGKDLVAVLPPDTKIRSLTVKDHVAYADFDDKLMKSNGGGSTTERLIVGAIVNTLTEFSDIKKVQILVDGKTVETLSGHMDVSHPLSRSEGIIKKP